MAKLDKELNKVAFMGLTQLITELQLLQEMVKANEEIEEMDLTTFQSYVYSRIIQEYISYAVLDSDKLLSKEEMIEKLEARV